MDMTSNQDSKAVEVKTNAVKELKRMALYREKTQGDIADAMKMSRQSLNRKLNNSQSMSLDDFVDISAMLDIKPSEVFRRAESAREKGEKFSGEEE